MDSKTVDPYKVGFWLADKKWNRINKQHLQHLLSLNGCLMVKMDLDQSLESQGPFDCIVHKVSEEMARSKAGDVDSRRRIETFEVGIESNFH